MKIQSKLLILIYGIVIFSIIFIIIFASLYGSIYQGRYYHDNETNISAPRNTHKTLTDIYTNPEKVKPSEILLVSNDDGIVKYINPTIPLNNDLSSYTIEKIIGKIAFTYSDRDVVFSSYNYDGESGFLIYSSVLPNKVSTRIYGIIPTVSLVSIILLVIPAVLALKVLRNLRSSLGTLEEAACNITEGNYDIKLELEEPDIIKVTEAFELMRKTLKDNEERRGRFFLAISHDLKTPLTSIKGYIEALQDGIPSNKSEVDEYLAVLWEKSDMLEKRILSLIDYAVADTANIVQEFKVFNAKEFFSALVLMFARDSKVRKVDFTNKIQLSDDININGSSKLLSRCFENLYDNAVKYSNEHKSVYLNVYTKYCNIIIEIQDSGIGIDNEIIDKIFDPFFRGDKNRNKPGFGLGLASVKSIIELHKGIVYCKNVEGVGSCFTVELPVV